VINGKPYSVTYNLIGWKLSFNDADLDEVDMVGVTSPTVLLGGAQGVRPMYAASGGSPTGLKKITVKDNPVAGAGGYLMADLNVGSVKTEYWVAEGGSIPNHSVSYLAWAHPGYMCSEIRMNGQLGLGGFVGGTLVPSTSGTADFVQMAKLTVNIESTGGGPSGAKPECMGYYTLSPASYYYTPDLPAVGPIPARAGERVTVTANARPGYRFVKWAGVGKAIVGGQEVPADKDCTLNPVTVVMHSDRELTAVFEIPYQSTCPEKMHPSTSMEQSSTFTAQSSTSTAQSSTSTAQSSTSTAQSGPNVTPDKVDLIRDSSSTPGCITKLTFPRGEAHATLDKAAMLWMPDYHIEGEIHWRASGPPALNYAATITDIGQSKQKWCAMAYYYANYPCFLSPGVSLGMCLSISEAHEQMHIDQIQAYL
jgi:hypothetical protein